VVSPGIHNIVQESLVTDRLLQKQKQRLTMLDIISL